MSENTTPAGEAPNRSVLNRCEPCVWAGKLCNCSCATPAGEGAAAPSVGPMEALRLAREYVKGASERMYDGTNGHGIRKEALRRLAIIDAVLASPAAPAGAPAGVLPKAPPSLAVALSMCREANTEARLPTPMCWDLALYVERLQALLSAGAPASQTEGGERG